VSLALRLKGESSTSASYLLRASCTVFKTSALTFGMDCALPILDLCDWNLRCPILLISFGSCSLVDLYELGLQLDCALVRSFFASSVDDLPDAIQHLSYSRSGRICHRHLFCHHGMVGKAPEGSGLHSSHLWLVGPCDRSRRHHLAAQVGEGASWLGI